jgi:hypothetical protein
MGQGNHAQATRRRNRTYFTLYQLSMKSILDRRIPYSKLIRSFTNTQTLKADEVAAQVAEAQAEQAGNRHALDIQFEIVQEVQEEDAGNVDEQQDANEPVVIRLDPETGLDAPQNVPPEILEHLQPVRVPIDDPAGAQPEVIQPEVNIEVQQPAVVEVAVPAPPAQAVANEWEFRKLVHIPYTF